MKTEKQIKKRIKGVQTEARKIALTVASNIHLSRYDMMDRIHDIAIEVRLLEWVLRK
jgi:hypothetical protein